MSKEAKEIIENTLRFFESNPNNWCQGTTEKENTLATNGTSHCLFGGLCIVNGHKVYAALETEMNKAVGTIHKVINDSLVTYNDAPGRTHEDILQVLRKARDSINV